MKTWTLEELGQNLKTKKWYCYPNAGEWVTVKVEGEFPQFVVDAANRIEKANQ